VIVVYRYIVEGYATTPKHELTEEQLNAFSDKLRSRIEAPRQVCTEIEVNAIDDAGDNLKFIGDKLQELKKCEVETIINHVHTA